MKLSILVTILAGTSLLAACGEPEDFGGNRLAAGNEADASAEGKAEDGRISMKGPGFDFAINLPNGITNHADVDDKIIYPGATIRGVHIAAAEGGKGGVELRFASRDPVDKVAAWYRDPARKANFSLDKTEQQGGETVFSGKTKDDGNEFKLHLAAKDDGSEGRLTLSDRD